MTKQKGGTREHHHFLELRPYWANGSIEKSNLIAAWTGVYVHLNRTNTWDPNTAIESRWYTLGMNPDDHTMGIRLHPITHVRWPPELSEREANLTKVTEYIQNIKSQAKRMRVVLDGMEFGGTIHPQVKIYPSSTQTPRRYFSVNSLPFPTGLAWNGKYWYNDMAEKDFNRNQKGKINIIRSLNKNDSSYNKHNDNWGLMDNLEQNTNLGIQKAYKICNHAVND